jgi:hypothetical protein
MGRLNLDESLAAGECRYIDEKELEMINSD